MKIDPFPGVLTAQFVDRPFTTKLGKAGCQRVKAWVLTDEQRAWLCKWFPDTIFKTKLDICKFQTVELPQNFNILHLDKQGGVPCIWYECESTMPLAKLDIYCIGTGWRMDDLPPVTYIGTIQHDGFVWHYYRAITSRRG